MTPKPLMTVVEPVNASVTLEDKYALRSGPIFLSGTQALVRLALMQAWRDRDAGLKTGGFISGYRGSPLAGYDTALWAAKPQLDEAGIVFQPGLNEELAATAVWGSQQVGLQPGANVDGVFSIWYAKGPGVDRSMDAIKHANAAGTSALGGVLAVFGDDHGAQSSTLLHQSEPMFEAALIPVLNPSDVREHIEFGLHGIALSRYAGCWVGLKATTEVVESSAIILADEPPRPREPSDFALPNGGLGIRWPDNAVDQERRMHGPRMAAIAAFARANPIDRVELNGGPLRLGIVTAGKAYHDVAQGLAELGIDRTAAAALGLGLYKVGMTWPLEVEGASRFADGHQELVVIEEKRAFIEPQLLALVQRLERPPRIVGKLDERGAPLVPSHGELSPLLAARVILERLKSLGVDVETYAARLETRQAAAAVVAPISLTRTPFFCSGCPHNSSTKVPEGSRALAGTGCHSMSMYIPDRNAAFLTQMGGEGANWIGQAPFTSEPHVFVNLGDGTFSHSGLMAVRAAAAAGVNVTYKILYNDAVAMTGGQENDAHLTVPKIAHQVRAEGAKRVVVLAEEVDRHRPRDFPPGTELLHRRELERVQRELRETPGLTVIIFDQVCAAEKRRRRKRKLYPAAPKRVFINEEVCEACGDCSAQSNCISVVPVETPLGRKRGIDQSSCNADYSCLNGFCPSFVTIKGAVARKPGSTAPKLDDRLAILPDGEPPTLDRPFNMLATGVGGTGVITVGAVIGMAAHLEGKAATTLDFTGLAQKNGPVTSHIRVARSSEELGPTRLVAGSADLVLACDAVVAASAPALSRMSSGRTYVVANTHVQPPGAFVLNTELDLESGASVAALRAVVGERIDTLDAHRLAVRLTGDSIFANLLMLGFAWQRGLVPIGIAALMRAIELNGAAVEANKRAFAIGRLAALDAGALHALDGDDAEPNAPPTLDEMVADRRRRLVAYQDEAYARRFDRLVQDVERAEKARGFHDGILTEAVAKGFHKLLAYKDEYEVARLYTDGTFERRLAAQLEGGGRREIHLAPPFLGRRDSVTGLPRKSAFGPWIFPVFRLLAGLKGLRGTAFDLFGHTAERRRERGLIDEYEGTIRSALDQLDERSFRRVLALAQLPMSIRGFGHIKARNMDEAARRRERLLIELRGNESSTSRESRAPAQRVPA